MIAGKDAFKPGEAKNSWLTGTAAWNFYTVSQFILGIRPQYDGLLIHPVIPASWQGYEVTRKFRGATYQITVSNPDGVSSGVKELLLNGSALQGNLVPVCEPGSVNRVMVTLGK
jgi:cellobiose phosphorylase